MKKFKHIALLTISFFVFLCVKQARCQEYNYKINAAYIYNFTKYIEWPAEITKTGNFVIGIIGNSPVYDELTSIAKQRKIGTKNIEVRQIKPEDAKFCHVVVVSNSSCNVLKQLSELTKSKPILVITEKESCAYKNACISLFLDEDNDYKTKFQLNRAITESHQLKISSQLTTLAVMVK